MHPLGSVYRKLRDRLIANRPREPEVRLQVFNLTRQTELASRLDVADNSAKRNRGLLGRKLLSPGEGLWILPCQAVHTFGMQFPIDLAYLDRKRRIRKVRSHMSPWRLSACFLAHSVLELPAGILRATETKKGDRLALSPVAGPDENVGGASGGQLA
jgi:uncharacterized membrane protein (UPF0127 family)